MLNLNHINILIVDDDELMREVLSELITLKTKAKIFEADNGKDAFKIVQNEKIHCVISDVKMPKGDGISLAKDLLTLKKEKPILFICSGQNELDSSKEKELNIKKIFEKPFEMEDILKELVKYFN
ncbi:response regulator [Pigmentibacter sp. JX0631]|uniref:response regulator n=1 Tax=Pigmentibacter sp. JX0631 TaxID=2976982 RepID=UPI0024696DA7|nr:response regulator [Pigmentibacter sp. JX0631]WGL59672.1 response regulator [Pigmentibacter sp. JX0631]